MNRKRIAIHEAGHLVMALILDLEVLECDVSRKRASCEGELGHCLVIDPDPVGVRRFLVTMAGVMAEDHFYSDDRGGLKDRKDAFELLRRYLNHYNRMPRYDSLKPILEEASNLFHKPHTLRIIEDASLMLVRKTRIGPSEIEQLRGELKNYGDHTSLTGMVSDLAEPEAALDWKQAAISLFRKTGHFLLRFRKM